MPPDNNYTEFPGMRALKICTCDCHRQDVQMLHCMPCCDRTYQIYTQKLWGEIPEIQQCLDDAVIALREERARNENP
jgi:hypothetical protein